MYTHMYTHIRMNTYTYVHTCTRTHTHHITTLVKNKKREMSRGIWESLFAEQFFTVNIETAVLESFLKYCSTHKKDADTSVISKVILSWSEAAKSEHLQKERYTKKTARMFSKATRTPNKPSTLPKWRSQVVCCSLHVVEYFLHGSIQRINLGLDTCNMLRNNGTRKRKRISIAWKRRRKSDHKLLQEDTIIRHTSRFLAASFYPTLAHW